MNARMTIMFFAALFLASHALAEEAPSKITASRTRTSQGTLVWTTAQHVGLLAEEAPTKLAASRPRSLQFAAADRSFTAPTEAVAPAEEAPTKITVNRSRHPKSELTSSLTVQGGPVS